MVNPKLRKWFACGGFRLGDFIFMMNRNMINTSRMNIDRFAKVFHRHGRTLDVPPGKAFSPRRVPVHSVISKSAYSLEPQRKISGMFFCRIDIDILSYSLFFFFNVLSGKFSISLKFLSV